MTTGLGVTEVVVTAQRRPERLQDVPISLTVRSGAELELLQATDMAALGKAVPSLVMMRTGAFTQPYLRGVGKRSTLGVENSVATYVDGVYLASSISALLDLRGIERVEVLNGPQGTLFGRNSTGGVIQVVTRDPTAEPAGEAGLHFGSYGYGRADAYLTGGTDRLAANLALSATRNGGYGRNLVTGKSDEGEVDHGLVARTKWIWRPADRVRVTLAADYQDIEQDFSQRPVDGFPPVGAPRIMDFRDGDQDASNRHHFRYGGASARVDAEVAGLSFMSLSAVRTMDARYGADLDQGPQPLLSANPAARQNQFSQELQLHSAAAARVPWIAGLYHIRLVERYHPTNFRYGGSYSAQLGGRVEQVLFDEGRVASYAAYGQATWPIAPRTRLTTGLRYTFEERTVRAQGEQRFDTPPFVRPISGLPLLSQAPLHRRRSFDELTWRVSLDRRFSDAVMGYVSASRGFQSGGWNLQTPQGPAFAPERLTAVEGGLKFVPPSGRLQAEASVFRYHYSDLQVSAFTPLGSVTTNATSADIHGLSLQFDAQLGAGTRISLAAQGLEARFNRFRNATCADHRPTAAALYAPISCDATGNRLPFAPAFRLNAGIRQDVALGRYGLAVLNGALAHSSGYVSEADNVVRQRPFTTIDVSAEWRPPKAGLSIRVWALNLTGSRHYASLATFPTAGVLQRPAAPRRFGASLIYDF